MASKLSKGAVKGEVLAKLIVEAVRLVEEAGFFVDAVVTDAATFLL